MKINLTIKTIREENYTYVWSNAFEEFSQVIIIGNLNGRVSAIIDVRKDGGYHVYDCRIINSYIAMNYSKYLSHIIELISRL